MFEWLAELFSMGSDGQVLLAVAWLPLAMMALSAVKARGQEHQAGEARKQEAITAALSPWTGMQAQRVQAPDTMGTLMQGAMGAAGMQQSMAGAEEAAKQAQAMQNQMAAQGKLLSAQAGYLKAMTPSSLAAQAGGQAAQAAPGAMGPLASAAPISPEIQAMYTNPQLAAMTSPEVAGIQSGWVGAGGAPTQQMANIPQYTYTPQGGMPGRYY